MYIIQNPYHDDVRHVGVRVCKLHVLVSGSVSVKVYVYAPVGPTLEGVADVDRAREMVSEDDGWPWVLAKNSGRALVTNLATLEEIQNLLELVVILDL